MNLLPQSPPLVNLEIIEVYEYYDVPCLFSCRNTSGQIFLAVWIDETPEFKTWLYVPMSQRRVENLRSGNIDLRDAFVNSEDNFVYKAIIPCDATPDRIETILSKNLIDDWLPLPGEFLNFGAEPLPIFETKEASRTATQIQREVLNIAFQFPTQNATEAPVARLGRLLESLQHLVDAVGQAIDGIPTITGKISQFITKKTELTVLGTFPGSFGIELAASDQSNTDDNSLAGKAMNQFLELVNLSSDAKNNAQELRKLLFSLNSRASSRYCNFLEDLLKSETNFRLNWGSPNQERGGYGELSISSIKEAIAVIQQTEQEIVKEYEIRGELIGINKRSKSYEILNLQTNKKVSGRIIDEAIPSAETATISEVYIATIREVKEISPIIPEGKMKYKLLYLRPVDVD
ncbi:DUF6575 domain-containing protein [Anabaena sp. WFMT]|uniref:DUF6575 domain-containing protein n=1 Tax=Anabaena sp. WFMT TaxID=3449730 RepID=UPI003F22839A